MSNATITNQVSRAKQLIAGTGKHYVNGSQTIQVAGATFTVTALTQFMQNFVDNRESVETSKAATKAKIETERTQAPSQIAVITAFEKVVRGSFGTSADVLADFGLTLPKARTPLTAEQKAVAVAKRAATRKARGTMGKVQKKAVKGAVNATLVVTPIAGPPPVVTAPPPATPVQAPTPAPVGGTTPHA
jgi:hypothetical protein